MSHRILRVPSGIMRPSGTAGSGRICTPAADRGKSWQLSEKGLECKGILGKTWQVTEKGNEFEGGAGRFAQTDLECYAGRGGRTGRDLSWAAIPACSLRSGDHGASWEMVDGLNHHATRAKWNPGAGGMMVHSIACLGKGRIGRGDFGSGGVSLERFGQDLAGV